MSGHKIDEWGIYTYDVEGRSLSFSVYDVVMVDRTGNRINFGFRAAGIIGLDFDSVDDAVPVLCSNDHHHI